MQMIETARRRVRINLGRPSLRAVLRQAAAGWHWTDLGVGLAFVLFLALVQFVTPDMPDNDGYYHIKLAALMRTEGLKPAFPWLPLTILNPREFYDHHFLFHVALIPFTFGDLRLAAKLASVVFAAIAMFSVWRLLYNQRVPYAWMWALGLMAVSEAFIYRMSITRAQSLSLAVLALALDWLLRRRYQRLLPLAFFYVWLYNAFPLLLILAGIYVIADGWAERRLDLRPLVYTAAGIGLGLLINPYFPYNMIFAVRHILPKLVEATAVSVGSEWYPYNTGQLLENSPLALVAFLSGVLALGLSGRRMDGRTMLSFLLACVFGLMLFQSRRFIEYFPPFALVFAAFAWAPLLERKADFAAQRAQGSYARLRRAFSVHGPAFMLALLLIPGIWFTLQDSRTSLRSSKPYTLYAGASAWLQANTPAGSRVFQTDWDDFPRLFFYNTHNTYLVGLDPTYLQIYNAGLYDHWVDLTRGEIEQMSAEIGGIFGAQYVLSDLRHDDFIRRAEGDPGLELVYQDRDAVVYRVRAGLTDSKE